MLLKFCICDYSFEGLYLMEVYALQGLLTGAQVSSVV